MTRNLHWKPGKSEFSGPTPVPTAPVMVLELDTQTGEWTSSEIPAEYVDIMIISMGLSSGLLNLPGMSRSVLQVAGYVLPTCGEEVIYH